MSIFEPSASLLCKLGSIAVHADELISEGGHEFDRIALQSLINDKDVQFWLSQMDTEGLLPKKRK